MEHIEASKREERRDDRSQTPGRELHFGKVRESTERPSLDLHFALIEPNLLTLNNS